MKENQVTEVVAALFWKKDTFMICRRPLHKARGGLWEFAGGKVETGESGEQALKRECREELGIEISVGEKFCKVVHTYPDLTVRLTIFVAEILSGEVHALEHDEIRWITPGEIDRYEFCPADMEILQKIRAEYRERLSERVREHLFSMQDLEYRAFHSRLMPTVDTEKVIGVRVPELRKFAKQFAKEADAEEFLKILPHRYYEEDNLHAFLLEQIENFPDTLAQVDRFLPYIDNWATCDMLHPKIFEKHREALLVAVRKWMHAKEVYVVRFGIGMLMRYFLDDAFTEEYPEWVAEIRREEYYINMMIAWYFATALAKQYEKTVCYLEKNRLDLWIHNKAIQKAIESNRIPPERKAYLRALKRK